MEIKLYKHKIPNWEDHRDTLIGMIPKVDKHKDADHETDFFLEDFFANTNTEDSSPELLGKHEQGWHHTDYLKETQIKYREYAHNLIKSLVEESLGNFDFAKTWYSRQVKGEGHPEHDHGTIGFASVLYVKFNPEVHKPTEYRFPRTDRFTSLPVEEGEIVIFPSLLKHRAPINEVDEERIIIAINITADN